MSKKNMKLAGIWILVFFTLPLLLNAQRAFQHPGILHKKSDLDRMKYGIQAGIEPWASSFDELKIDSYSSYDYTVRGDASWTYLNRENPAVHSSEYSDDVCAAYQNALMWYFTDDQRHADKAIEILNTWSNLRKVDGIPLGAGLFGFPLIQTAELIRHTNAGWSEADIQKFSAMLVYPGYSNTQAPTTDSLTFYWKTYLGDDGRHGNQDASCYMTVMAIGVFLDNDIIYDRALRYVLGQKHRPDDLPYPSGPKVSTTIKSQNPYYIDYNYSKQSSIEDYGYDGVIEHYIYDNGQCQESSRDQSHPLLGIHILNRMAETAWIQGDDIYGHLDNRLLLGLEYSLKYNVSFEKSYPDQLEPWEPSKELGEFYDVFSRTGRWKSVNINPWTGSNLTRNSRGGFNDMTYYEMPLNHYKNRTNVAEEDYLWLQRARDLNIENTNAYEGRAKQKTDSPGWGALCYQRPTGCAGEPLKNIVNNIPEFELPVVPTTIEAENFDYYNLSAGGGEGLTYHDVTSANTGGQYRTNDGVDIETCSEGGYQLSSLEDGEWLTYTVYVPESKLYNIVIGYASANANGKIKFSFGDKDKTDELTVPHGDANSTGLDDWKSTTIASDVILSQGVQSMKISISGESDAFKLNYITIVPGTVVPDCTGLTGITPSNRIVNDINYSYYEGTWTELPDFDALTPVKTGYADVINHTIGEGTENFGLVFDGYIYIPIKGEYTFYLNSDAGSILELKDTEVINNDGLHDATEKSYTQCLDIGYYPLRLEYFKTTGTPKLSLQYSGPGVTKKDIDELYGIGPCENVAVEAPTDLTEGIKYSYYEGTWNEIPNFSILSPIKTGKGTSINLNNRINTDNFGFLFEGYIYIEQEGDYIFYAKSDDGSRITIGGNIVVDNDGTHGAVEESGSLCLGVGYYFLTVEYFDKTGSNDVLEIRYAGPGISKQYITDFYVSRDAVSVKPKSKLNDLKAYPNPIVNDLTIELENYNFQLYEVYNLAGEKVLADKINKEQILLKINFDELPKGAYLISLQGNDLTETLKVIKNK